MKAATQDLKQKIIEGKISKRVFNKVQLDQIMGGKAQIEGLTWHHHQDLGRMQLMPRDVHQKVSHVGGMKLWHQ